jgi:tRNA(fMet)-specific endonuclease VapC
VVVNVAIDTNRYRDLCEGHGEVLDVVQKADRVVVPFVVLAELRAGFAVGSRGSENERTLLRFLAKPGVEVAYATDATTRSYASLYRQLRAAGTPIPTNGLWIAAVVVEHGLTLLSADAHFRHVPQIRVI